MKNTSAIACVLSLSLGGCHLIWGIEELSNEGNGGNVADGGGGDGAGASGAGNPDGGNGATGGGGSTADGGGGGGVTDGGGGGGPDPCGEIADCLGGECVNEVCQPFLVATIEGLAADDMEANGDYIYFTLRNQGKVQRVSRFGGTPEDLTAADIDEPYGIDVAPPYVFYTDRSGWLHRLTIGPTVPFADKLIGIQQDDPVAIHYNGTTLVWVNHSGGTLAGGNVQRGNLDAGQGGAVATQQYQPNDLAVVGNDVYWVNRNGGSANPNGEGSIYKGSLTGGNPTSHVTGLYYPDDIVFGASNLFFTQRDANYTGALYRVDGTTAVFVFDGNGVTDLEVDVASDGMVFSSDQDASYILLDASGGNSQVLNSGAGVRSVAIDADATYYSRDNGIYLIAR